jgi:hypothetical protein
MKMQTCLLALPNTFFLGLGSDASLASASKADMSLAALQTALPGTLREF